MAKLLTGTRIYGTGTVDTQLFVNGTEQAVSTTTGALEVIGGAGIGGNLHLGGISVSAGVQSTNIVASGTLGVTGTTTLRVLNATSATFSGTLGVTGTSVLNGLQASNIVASGTLGVTGTSTLAGITLVTNTTSATSITTGALVVSGGVGIGQDLRVGGVIYGTFNGAVTGTATNAINISGGTVGQVPYQTAPGTTSFYGPGTAGNVLVSNGAAAPSYNNTLTLTGAAAATNATSGALQIVGGVGINDNLFVSNNINAVSGQFVSTRANNATTDAGQILLNGATGNRIDFNINGVAGPAFTTRSAGTKLVLYPNISASSVDFALGIESNTMWFSTYDNAGGQFKWYHGITNTMVLAAGGNLTLVGDLAVNGGDITTTQATFNLINTTATTVNFAGAATALTMGAVSGTTNVRNNLTVSGNLTVQGTTTIVDSTVTNIADPIITLGGGTGNTAPTADDNKDRGVAFKWVNNGGTTSTGFFGYDDSTGHFTYVQTATITNEVVSGTKGAMDVNLAGGTAMSLVYQSAANTTAFLAAGSSGFILQTNGTSAAPTWVSSAGIGAGSATNSDAIRTIERTTAAAHFLTFVDSNNATNAYESLYTTSSFTINPQSGFLTVANTARIGATVAQGDPSTTDITANATLLLSGVGGNYLAFGQKASNLAQWIQSSYSNPTTAVYPISLNPLGGNVGIGTITPATKLDVAGTLGFTAGSAAGIIRRTTVNGSNGIRIQGNASDTITTDAAAGAYITVGGGVIGDTFEGNIDIVAYGGNVDANRNQIRFSNRSGANTITERMRIDKDGNVGIGTASPTHRLTVTTSTNSATTTASTIALHLFNSASDGNISQPGRVGIGFGASSTRSAIVAGTYGNDYLDFYTSGDITTPRVRIRSTGAIAFSGTNTHGSNGFVLKSNGDAAPTWADPSTLASGSATNADAIRTVAQAANTSYYPTFVDSNNASNAYELVYTTSSFQINPFTGNIQIGMTSQDYQPSSGGNHTIRLNALNTSSIGFHDSGSTIASIKFSGAYGFEIGAYDGLYGPHNTILHGNVGIGTQSPGQVLEVNGRGLFTGATTASAGSIQVTSTDAAIRLKWTSSPVADKNTWDIRSVGTGTTPFLQFRTINDANTVFTDRVVFTNDGNVGVGTTAPRGKFESVTGANGVNTNADVPGTAGAFVGPTGAGQGSQLSIESNDAIAADTGGVLAFGGRYSGTALATWAAIKGLKEDAIGGNYGGYLSFYTRTTGAGYPERMRITPAGGISFGASGTAYGSSGQVLQSNGNAAPTWINQSSVTSGATSLTNTYVGYGSASNLLTGSSNFTWDGTKLLVSGTSISPYIKVSGTGGTYSYIQLDDSSSNGYLIKNVSSGTGNGALAGALYTYTDNSKAFQHIHAGTPLFTILSTGNVGIGTSSPSVKLHVAGSSIIANNTSINPDTYANQTIAGGISDGSWGVSTAVGGNAGTGKSWAIGHNGSYLYHAVGNNTAAGSLASYMVVGGTTRNLWLVPSTGGNVSIGFAEGGGASHRLDINSPTTYSYAQGSYSTGATIGLRAASTTANDYTGIRFTNNNGSREAFFGVVQGTASNIGDFVFQTYSATTTSYGERMRVMHNGNVGIGTTNPANKFEVAGTAGQLFSISDSFTGTIFSANDVSGIPSIEVLDTGLVKLAQYNGSVAISTGTAVSGSALSVYGIISTIGTTGEIRASSEITAYYSSDARLKENIKLIENPITILDQIRGVTFDWTDEHMARRGGEDGYFVRKHDIGVIAQEVQAVLPELVGTREDGYLAVKYEKMVALLIEAIKEQQKSIDMLKIELEKIKKQ